MEQVKDIIEKEIIYRQKLDFAAVEMMTKVKNSYEKKISSLEEQLEQHKYRLEYLRELRKSMEDEISSLKSEREKLSQLDELKKDNEKLTQKYEIMKNTCSKVEDQVIEFQELYQSQIEVSEKLKREKETIIEEMKKEQEKLFLLKEEEIKNVNENLENQKTEFQTFFQAQIDITNQVKFEKEIIEEELHKEREKLNRLKEEASGHISSIAELSTQNKKLVFALEDALSKCEGLENKVAMMAKEMCEEKNRYEVEQLKAKETTNQQLKLIEMLQNKIENFERNKKPWFAINSPHKTHISSPSVNKNMNIQIKELEAQLLRERAKNEMLIHQIQEANEELERHTRERKKVRPNKSPNDEFLSEKIKYENVVQEINQCLELDRMDKTNNAFEKNEKTQYRNDSNDSMKEENFSFSDSILNDLMNNDENVNKKNEEINIK